MNVCESKVCVSPLLLFLPSRVRMCLSVYDFSWSVFLTTKLDVCLIVWQCVCIVYRVLQKTTPVTQV